MPVLEPMVIIQGVTQALRLNTSIEDWTGWTLNAQIRPEPGSAVELASWSNGAIEARPYAIFVPLDPETTSAWTWTRAWFGLEARSPQGQLLRLAQRPVILDREVVIQ